MILNTIEEVIAQLNEQISKSEIKIIAIDGKDGVGKSTLANQIVKYLQGSHIELDNFILKNKGCYIPALKIDELKSEILKSPGKLPIVIDGICVQEALKAIDTIPNVTIYVKRIGQFGEWSDEDKFELFATPEEVFQKDKEDLRHFHQVMHELAESNGSEDDRESIFHEIVRYHYKFKPHITSDIVYHNKINGA